MLTRYPDWQSRLERFISAHRAETFAYGRWDCCLFVCSAIEAMTGTDIAARFRGRYACRREAMIAVREVAGRGGVRAIAEFTAIQFRMQPVPITRAKRGDMALVRWKSGYLLGLISMNGREVLAVSATGFVTLPLSTVAAGWTV